MLIIATLATLIGVSLGLLGGGGSILAVPLLAYVAQVPAKEAIATSLIVVGGTAVPPTTISEVAIASFAGTCAT